MADRTAVTPATGNLFQRGDFNLHSGDASAWKIECDALTDEDVATIAMLLAERLPAFGEVQGVPRGGFRLAEALRAYVTTGPLLLVDDVLTTGASMAAIRGDTPTIGAVIFSRGDTPSWIVPLFQTWLP